MTPVNPQDRQDPQDPHPDHDEIGRDHHAQGRRKADLERRDNAAVNDYTHDDQGHGVGPSPDHTSPKR